MKAVMFFGVISSAIYMITCFYTETPANIFLKEILLGLTLFFYGAAILARWSEEDNKND
ncbi:hypothetical protein ACFL0F_00155 [Patescibacteria group bacterium]